MIRKRILSILATAALFAGGAVATAPAASAGDCHLGGILCGKIYNSTTSHGRVWVGSGWWNGQPTDPVRYSVIPGQSSTQFLRDSDAFMVSPGCTVKIGLWTYSGGRWHKLSDAGVTRVATVRC